MIVTSSGRIEEAHSILAIRGLRVEFDQHTRPAVEDVTFDVPEGSIVGLVGESGSGKSMTLSACMGMVPGAGKVTSGTIEFDGQDITHLGEEAFRKIRGRDISMILQDPLRSLHPSITVRDQMLAILSDHQPAMDSGEALKRCTEALARVGVPDGSARLGSYPHQLSGGLRQRVMIAMTLLNQPRVLLADEPTTALDVTVQAQILALLRDLNRELGLTVLLVTHNFGVVAELCDYTVVMRHGRVVEMGPTGHILHSPRHEYTRRLLDAVPRVDRPGKARAAVTGGAILEGKNFNLSFASTALLGRRHRVTPMRDVSLTVRRGETLGLVGESGAGKSTLARTLIKLQKPDSGQLIFDGQDVTAASRAQIRDFRRRIQMVFQDPYSSLDPRWTVERIVSEGMRFHRVRPPKEIPEAVRSVISQVGLEPDQMIHRLPKALSGGERQRVAIARAIAVQPDVLVADEPVSALDVSIQAQIVELFQQLKEELNLTLIMVAHDLGLVRSMCDRVALMRAGELVEYGETETVFTSPRHEYTRQLLAAAPRLPERPATATPAPTVVPTEV